MDLLLFSLPLSMDLAKKQQQHSSAPLSPNYYSLPRPIHLYNQTCDFCPHHNEITCPMTESYHGFDYDLYNSSNVFQHTESQDQPFKYNYLLNLFTTPNMASYLTEAAITDDVYALPIHLQRLLMEAKEEVIFDRTRFNQEDQQNQFVSTMDHPALQRLERVRSFCWLRSDADVANLMSTVTELVADDDELERILMD